MSPMNHQLSGTRMSSISVPRRPRARGGWNSLPTELQLEIHEIVCQIRLRYRRSLACYATVNEQWRLLTEAKTFQSLALHQNDIGTFERIVHHNRRDQLKRVWLTVELPEYSCWRTQEPETAGEIWDNSAEFTKALTHLLFVLSVWESEDAASPEPTSTRKITLEISAHSWSDGIHNNLYWRHVRNVPWIRGKLRSQLKSFWLLRHLYHCSCRDRQPVPERSMSHPQGLSILDGLCGEIKPVRMINKLVVLVHTSRAISIEATILRLSRKLPHLESLHYEPWRGTDLHGRNARESDYLKLVRDILWDCLSIKELHIYEDNSQSWNIRKLQALEEQARPSAALGQSLCTSSRYLRSLSVLNMMDACDFFHAFLPSSSDLQNSIQMEWPYLEHLTLTSECPSESRWRELITSAGKAAKKMPRLKMMEILECGVRPGRIFRYEQLRSSSSILVHHGLDQALGHRDIGEEARFCWEEVAILHHPRLKLIGSEPLKFTFKPHPQGSLTDGDHLRLLSHLKSRRNLHHRTSDSPPWGVTEEEMGPSVLFSVSDRGALEVEPEIELSVARMEFL